MAGTYLTTPFKDKDRVKSLGARWDAERRSWYVPEGLDLALFSAWLPQGPGSTAVVRAPESALSTDTAPRGLSLSQLLAGVSQAVAAAYRAGVWTRAEVIKVDVRRGHIYLELTERGADGGSLAQARAIIWADTANTIVPAFERATGAVLGPGIKLLVRARPTIHAQYGLGLTIDGIDPEYTLGDLEARKREIRERLRREGLFELNRQLAPPWDYRAVLVVAPEGAAGLGDFEAEAKRLERHALCRFVYAHSRFQGEGAAREIREALMDALDHWRGSLPVLPDAVAIIRGGGAVNDLAWLNDYDLVRCVCELDIPVLTGIGHERDTTLLDEVAHQGYDTPSKVIAGIEQRIRQRADEARAAFETIVRSAGLHLQMVRRTVERGVTEVQIASRQGLASASRRVEQDLAEVRLKAVEQVRMASERSSEAIGVVRAAAQQDLASTRAALDGHIGTVRFAGSDALARASSTTRRNLDVVLDRTAHDLDAAREAAERGCALVGELARRVVTTARDRSESLLREIAGQGPDKTLGRGFAVVRTADGKTLTRAGDVRPQQAIELQFGDGRIGARIDDTGERR